MKDFPETRDSLIIRVKDQSDQEAWDLFVQIYRPVIFRLARGRGLQDADSHDLAQQVLLSVSGAVCNWEKRDDSTRFRHWLSRITKHAIINAITRIPRDLAFGGSSSAFALENINDSSEELAKTIEAEYRRELYLKASEIVKGNAEEATWSAFELTVIRGLSPANTAELLGISTGSVYTARSRVMSRLRKVVQELEEKL